MAKPNQNETAAPSGKAQAGPSKPCASTTLRYSPKIGQEVQFAYGSEAVLRKATVVFIWPGDAVDLDVRIGRARRARYERIRPHSGSKPQPNTWQP